MSDERNCVTCAHRYGVSRTYWRCQATGYYCDVTSASTSNRCVEPTRKLWEPRRPWYRRVVRFFVGVKA